MAKRTSNSSRGKSARKKTTAKPANAAAKTTAADAASAATVAKDTAKTASAESKSVPEDVKKAVADKTTPDANVASTPAKVESKTAASAAKPATTEPRKRGSVFPLVLGGLIAGGIGYGAATYLPQWMGQGEDPVLTGIKSSTSQNSQSLSDLKAQVAELSARPQVPDLSSGLADLGGKVDQVQADLSAATSNLSGLSDRMTLLEKRPMNDALSPEAVAAYEAELAQLREDVTAQSQDIQSVASNAKAELAAVLAEASALETSAQETAKLGAAQAAAGLIQAEVAAGAPFADAIAALSEISDLEIPAVLSAVAEDGVVTVDALQKDFPDLARQALAAARQVEGPSEGENGVSSFFKSQLGVRALEPQDGTSADAVLSRAEFAAKEGRFADALTEIDALPDVAKTVFDGWRGKADQRTAALAAADALAASLEQN